MDFSFTPEQELLRRTARELLTATAPMQVVRSLMRSERGSDVDHWRRMAELGWQGLLFPEEYGGAALSLLELAIILEEMGRVVLPSPFLGTVVAGLALVHAGSDAQRRRWLPGICDGSVVASLALVEDGASFAPADVASTATRADGGWVLAGSKRFVADAAIANVVVAVVRIADGGDDAPARGGSAAGDRATRDPRGFAVATIERAAIRALTPTDTVDATRRVATVGLDGIRLASAEVAPCDAAALATVLDQARVATAAEMCGGAERVLELTVDYAKVREQFGRPIGSFQAIQHKCADMSVAVECAKAATYYAAWAAAERADDVAIAAAGAKALASDTYRDVTTQSVQIHGGIGFTWEHDLHIYFKRAMSTEAAFGDATFNRELVAQRLGL